MGYYRELGVYDWTARLASATGALALIILAFLHLKRFRPGGHLDAALIMVSAVAMFAFSRGALYGYAARRALLYWHAGVVCVV